MNNGYRSLLTNIPAVILAGGKGTRLRPFTVTFPKPLVPLGDRPILDRLLRQLAHSGVRKVTLSLGHLSSLIRAYISQHDGFGGEFQISFVDEKCPLGTAGSLKLVSGLDQTFLVINGDLLTDIDFGRVVETHQRSGAAVTISRYIRTEKTDFGVLELDKDGFITGYSEKPEYTYSVSMGVYVYEPRVLNYMQYNEYLDFPTLILRLLDNGEHVGSYLHTGLWLDIGRPDDYAKAQDIVTSLDSWYDAPLASNPD
jgi:NDP-sugar pyrophosphorylase family protein